MTDYIEWQTLWSGNTKGGGIGVAGAAMAAPLFRLNMAMPYDHALIDKHPGRTVLFGHVHVQIDGAAANDSSHGTGMLINTFENSERAYSQDHEY